MLNVCVKGVMEVMFSVCIMTHGAVGARVYVAFCMACSLL